MSVHFLSLPLVFPYGVAAGEGSDFNRLRVARDGSGRPLLRGTAIAGVLRSAWREQTRAQGVHSIELENALFGWAPKDDSLASGDSPLSVPDCIIQTGNNPILDRTHHLRNRHTKTVVDGGLFTLEHCPPGSTVQLTLWLDDESIQGEFTSAGKQLLQRILGLFEQGIVLGGKSARGIGLAELASQGSYRCYDLSNLDDHVQYLDDHWNWRADSAFLPKSTTELNSIRSTARFFSCEIELSIPRGQDLLVADGQGLDFQMEPQRARGADGKSYWRLPGSSLRGVFRAWMTRLAAIEGRSIADRYEYQAPKGSDGLRLDADAKYRITGDRLARGFSSDSRPLGDHESLADRVNCVILDLFGSLYQRGRLRLFDSLSQDRGNAEEYRKRNTRTHVAIDRITGGAAESMLFDNAVLTADDAVCFRVRVQIADPKDYEVLWLRKSLIALHLGLLRVGSSKSAGRLEVRRLISVDGEHREQLKSIDFSKL